MKHVELFLVLVGVLTCSLCCGALAEAEGSGREAGRHFQRGVDLYNDGDFRGALVEFKRAYALLPRASVLYDIGETEFQLQDYAAALGTMRRFLAETGPSAPHRAEVEATVETLRGRVGRIALMVDASCQVSLDDQPLGSTPLAEPILASVGQRLLTLNCADRPLVTRRVEVTAGELARIDLRLPAAALRPVERVATKPERPQPRRHTALALSWTATTLVAAATLSIGTAALVESSQLAALRRSYPATPADLDRKAGLTHALSIAADAFGLATLAAIGVSTYVTIKDRRERHLVVGVGPGSIELKGRF